VGDDEKYKEIENGIRSWIFVGERKKVKNQSDFHFL